MIAFIFVYCICTKSWNLYISIMQCAIQLVYIILIWITENWNAELRTLYAIHHERVQFMKSNIDYTCTFLSSTFILISNGYNVNTHFMYDCNLCDESTSEVTIDSTYQFLRYIHVITYILRRIYNRGYTCVLWTWYNVNILCITLNCTVCIIMSCY